MCMCGGGGGGVSTGGSSGGRRRCSPPPCVCLQHATCAHARTWKALLNAGMAAAAAAHTGAGAGRRVARGPPPPCRRRPGRCAGLCPPPQHLQRLQRTPALPCSGVGRGFLQPSQQMGERGVVLLLLLLVLLLLLLLLLLVSAAGGAARRAVHGSECRWVDEVASPAAHFTRTPACVSPPHPPPGTLHRQPSPAPRQQRPSPSARSL